MSQTATSSASIEAAEVRIEAGEVLLEGTLEFPVDAVGIVLFAHGSGSSRFSSRNRRVARYLRAAGLGTLLFDLLTPAEERTDEITAELRFNMRLLAPRLSHVSGWVRSRVCPRAWPIGYFGSSTGAAAALIAAALEPDGVAAVVSRGGRPDLAGEHLSRVRAPTLLIVGGADAPVISLNEEALARLRCVKRMETVPGASHLFEEPGALEAVARLAANWFNPHLGAATRRHDGGPSA